MAFTCDPNTSISVGVNLVLNELTTPLQCDVYVCVREGEVKVMVDENKIPRIIA